MRDRISSNIVTSEAFNGGANFLINIVEISVTSTYTNIDLIFRSVLGDCHMSDTSLSYHDVR